MNISPELFTLEVSGVSFALRWYALAYVAGFAIGWFWMLRLIRKPDLWPDGRPSLTSDQVDRLLTWLIVGMVGGGRIGYAVFYEPGRILADPVAIFKIWEGGMSFHGGLVGAIVAGLVFCRVNRLSYASVGDAIAFSVVPGLFLGRVANFINGELWGRVTEVPWAVIFPRGITDDCPLPCARHPSQLYEAALEGLILCGLLVWLIYRRKWLRHPGRITGVFLTGYSLARITVEFFRMPDAQFASPQNPMGFILQFSQSTGLTMGQLLTLPMLAIGIFLLARTLLRVRE